MTPDEMETKINTLSEQVETLQQRQEAERKHWAQCGRFALVAVVPLALLLMASAILGIIAHKTDPITQVFGAAMTITLFLGLAFQRAAGTAQRS
jgi:type III secretory pathway component EscT